MRDTIANKLATSTGTHSVMRPKRDNTPYEVPEFKITTLASMATDGNNGYDPNDDLPWGQDMEQMEVTLALATVGPQQEPQKGLGMDRDGKFLRFNGRSVCIPHLVRRHAAEVSAICDAAKELELSNHDMSL